MKRNMAEWKWNEKQSYKKEKRICFDSLGEFWNYLYLESHIYFLQQFGRRNKENIFTKIVIYIYIYLYMYIFIEVCAFILKNSFKLGWILRLLKSALHILPWNPGYFFPSEYIQMISAGPYFLTTVPRKPNTYYFCLFQKLHHMVNLT